MHDAYPTALQAIADTYEAEVAAYGGRSLSRVATIVVSSGAFFQRLRSGKPFLVQNLDKFAAWFRDPSNWPTGEIPHSAVLALTSIGRPPSYRSAFVAPAPPSVRCDQVPGMKA